MAIQKEWLNIEAMTFFRDLPGRLIKMHMRKLEHLGIAVKDLETSNKLFTRLLGVEPYKQEPVQSEHVITSFFRVGETKIELLQATDESSAIAKFIEKKGEGIHHIAFDVANIHQEMLRLQEEGFQFIHEIPKDGADNKLIAFMHPKSTGGVLVELCQEKDPLI